MPTPPATAGTSTAPRATTPSLATVAGTRLITDPTEAPAGHYDLLTTMMHEMGHALGLGDRYEGTARDALMYGWLFTGERRLPGAGEADGAVAGSITTEEFAGCADRPEQHHRQLHPARRHRRPSPSSGRRRSTRRPTSSSTTP